MSNPFTFEPEAFEYTDFGDTVSTEFDEYEQSEPAWAGEFEMEAEASPAKDACPGYNPGEVKKSWTAAGHLPSDVIPHARGLLVADFGVNWRTPRNPLKGNQALKDWFSSIVPVVQSNPTTVIRLLGFSDCVGRERNNRFLRQGRANRVLALLDGMFRRTPQWRAIRPNIKVAGAPIGQYLSSNATVEGRAENRSVLIESTRTVDFEPHVVKSCKFTPQQAKTYPLLGVIPNMPDHQRYVPLDYRLDAKQIVGRVAQDLSKAGKKAHFWTDLIHWIANGAEIFAHASKVAGLLGIASPILAVFNNLMMLKIPCIEAAQEIAAKSAARGFARGVVMGADGRPPELLRDYFGNEHFPKNPFCPEAEPVDMANYKLGLLVGYVNGRVLCPNQRAIFYKDLSRRMGDQSHLGDSKNWGRRQWVDWYVTASAIFRKHHLTA